MIFLSSLAFVAVITMGYVIAKRIFKTEQVLTNVPRFATQDFAVLDFVEMQIPDENNVYTNLEGIVAEVDENNMTRVITNGQEISMPSVMLSKSEN
jgi:hypothetical protein